MGLRRRENLLNRIRDLAPEAEFVPISLGSCTCADLAELQKHLLATADIQRKHRETPRRNHPPRELLMRLGKRKSTSGLAHTLVR